ncbi:unnamed protein product [Parnassius apollo]|uniref:(apollo) hypothetical protein n=1 Tax=Parnassius apollo TaxID=110799 RepID=A0A8S3YDS5_PARAO|nr:unnamed protein product [Parnassius apollo]CAG5058282.1 unnamed protein product [Parnassius apollo]
MFFKCFLVLFIIGSVEADFRYSSASCGFPRLQNGRVRVRQRSKLVKFICLPRYELVGNKYATCRGTEWDVPLPVCVRPGCPLPQIENGVQMPSRHNAWVVFFCLPGHKMIGSSTIYCDGRRWNGTAPSCVDSTAPSPLKCDFEEPNLCGWTQDDLHDFDWKRLNTKTPSSFLFTGPSYDHTLGRGGSGYYMYIESTSRFENDTARLISPIFDGALAKDGCFVFFYHMFGKTTGGLRVYEKPENYALDALLSLPSSEKQKYILFEKWGNQGDVWYDAVLPLTDFSDNFQIVIEGIRGSSSTSDIAIDDVAILQGSNCTVAKHEATTPSNNMPDSCADRCGSTGKLNNELGCDCTINCVNDRRCCPDFFDLCLMFSTDSDDSTSNTSMEIAPQTQKLVATTPETTSSKRSSTPIAITKTTPATTSTTAATTSTTPATTISTTVKRTTTSTTSTTSKPTTKTATKPPTTLKRRTLVFKTSTPVYKFTENTHKLTTIKTTITTKLPTKTTQASTIKIPNSSTKTPKDYSRPIEDHDVYRDMVEKAKMEHEAEQKKERSKIVSSEEPKSRPSGLKIGLIILIAIGCCAGLAWLIVEFGGTRGRIALARFRGHLSSDPEVRYLSTDVDDD